MRMSNRSKQLWMVWLATAAVTLAACGDDDGGAVETVTQLIGPEGGTVELASGGKVEIPPGALADDVEITITKLPENNTFADLPDNLEPAGKPYAFKPHGQEFAVPVKVEVPYTGSAMDVRPVKLPNETEQDSAAWTTVAPSMKDTVNSKVSGYVSSFSVVIAARPRRNSGVITLLDGAIDDGSMPAGSGGEGGGGGMAGTAGEGGSAGSAGEGGDASVAGTGGVAGGEDDAGVIGGTGGSSDGGVTCNGMICNGECIDTDSDTAHCGACGARCGEGHTCVDGVCECPVENRCGIRGSGHDGDAGVDLDAGGFVEFMCADLGTNRHHCGSCSNACATGETCVDGTCTLITCAGGQIRCGNDCVDPQTDLHNCGGCGIGNSDGESGMVCYVEDYYCEYDCIEIYGGTLCDSGVPGYSECVDDSIDRNNCGGCGVACGSTQVCNDGTCEELTCGSGEVPCDGVCVSGDSCGESCGVNATCDEGSCACNSGTVACGEHCVDTNNDDDNCGACGTECMYGESCVSGTCECAGVNPAVCDGYCSDVDSDNYNCGACYNYCYAGEQCVAGACVPAACEGQNQYRCGGSECTDTNSNVFHCGGCTPEPDSGSGETCLRFETCICSEYGLTECAINQAEAVCTDTTMDRNHCGTCGNACATGTECIDGSCQPIDCGSQTLCGNDCVASPTCGVQCNYQAGELCGSGVCYQGT